MAYITKDSVQKCLDDLSGENLIGNENDTFISLAEAKDRIEELPTADVAPRAEVERLQAEVDRLKKDNEYILMQHRFQRRPSGDCWNDVIEKAKTEVAAEIFAEIYSYLTPFPNRCAIMSLDALAELKKKYTEEQP